VVHLRIVAPHDLAAPAIERLCATVSAVNVARLPGAAVKPDGDVIPAAANVGVALVYGDASS
jgi:hypothetical protein